LEWNDFSFGIAILLFVRDRVAGHRQGGAATPANHRVFFRFEFYKIKKACGFFLVIIIQFQLW
jgi:hypothetical protein